MLILNAKTQEGLKIMKDIFSIFQSLTKAEKKELSFLLNNDKAENGLDQIEYHLFDRLKKQYGEDFALRCRKSKKFNSTCVALKSLMESQKLEVGNFMHIIALCLSYVMALENHLEKIQVPLTPKTVLDFSTAPSSIYESEYPGYLDTEFFKVSIGLSKFGRTR